MALRHSSNPSSAETSASLDPSTAQRLSIQHVLRAHANRSPDAAAIVSPGRAPLTYATLHRQVEETIEALNLFDIGRNDCVATVLPDGPEAVVAFLSLAAGATCAPLNPHFKASEFDSYLSKLGAKALLVQSGMDSPAARVAREHDIPVIQLVPTPEAEGGVFTLKADEHVRLPSEGFAKPDNLAFVLLTSGTTSSAKLVALTQANLHAAAYAVQLALEISPEDRYLNVSHLFYSQGMMLTFSSILSGASVVCTTGFSAERFFRCLEECRPTWYSAAPAVHRAILAKLRANDGVLAGHPLRFIRSAAAPLPPKLLAELEAAFGSPVIEGYGMTECYPITSNPLPPGKRIAGSVGVVAAGTEVAILDSADHSLSCGEIGEIIVSGPQVTRGYLNDPDDNRNTFVNGWFRTGDLGNLDDEGYLFVTGRLKEVINRGGEKISSREVDEVLLEHAAVIEAASFPVAHPTLGEDVAAAVVLREDASVTPEEIRDFAATKLIEFKVPRQVVIVDQLPKTTTGKVHRVGLAETLGLSKAPAVGNAHVVSRTATEDMLAKIWASVLGLAVVGVYDNFFDLGGNSLLGLELTSRIERMFGKTLPLAVLVQAPTIIQLSNLIQEETWPKFSPFLIPIQPRGSKPPFFLVHGDESNIILRRYIEADQPLYALMHQAEDGSPARFTSVETIATHYLNEIRAVQPTGNYFLGGYSFGGTVAFEMAQQLTRQGEHVALLLLLDSHFPGRWIVDTPNAALVGDESGCHPRPVAVVEDEGKLIDVGSKLKDKIQNQIIGIQTKMVKSAKCALGKIYLALGRRLPVSFRSQYILDIYDRARLNYMPRPYVGRAIYIKSEKRAPVHMAHWRGLVNDGLETLEIPGDHRDVIREPSLGLWAKNLQDWINARAEEARSGFFAETVMDSAAIPSSASTLDPVAALATAAPKRPV
jgi:oxalate---CoA ligase